MKALVCHELSGPEALRLEELPTPEPGPGEVQIAVAAAGVNFADSLITAGKYQVKPNLPFVPGFELSGQVTTVGPDVTRFQIGDCVMAIPDFGAFAENIVVKEQLCFLMPPTMDFSQAAGFPITYGTAHAALRWQARLGQGETLLVHGASGGVGLAAVEVGKAMGARVIATAKDEQKLRTARAHGADYCLESCCLDLRDRVKDLTDGRGADVVFDPVGGDLFDKSLRCIAFDGRLVIIGFAGGRIQEIPANILMVKTVSAVGFNWGGFRNKAPERLGITFGELLAWYQAGLLSPEIFQTLPLESGAEAIGLLTSRTVRGKVVLEYDS